MKYHANAPPPRTAAPAPVATEDVHDDNSGDEDVDVDAFRYTTGLN